MNKAVTIRLDQMDTPIGTLDVAWSDAGLHMIGFALAEGLLRTMLEEHGVAPAPALVSETPIGEALERYFAGDTDALSKLPVVLRGTDFQLSVWKALREIPTGQTLSYGALAERIGHAGAARAVGTANGKNPIPIVIPCHRVIAAGGRLGGYGGGLERKRWLLRHEGAAFVDR